MRMYPPAWLLTRRPIADVQIGGHRIPAGSSIYLSPYAIHHDPTLYPDPDRFDPDRWISDRQIDPRGIYLPFGAGIRGCIGEGFAWTEMLIIMSTILRRWTLHADPGRPIRPVTMGALRPGALPMCVREHAHAADLRKPSA
jgi:cytochrome P450